MRQNYNMANLSGMDVDDMDYVESYNLPHALAYTPEINKVMLDRVYEDNVASFMENGLRESEAANKAMSIRKQKEAEIKTLLASRGLLND